MTPQAFIAHWQHNNITERAGAQQHFNDLCEVLDVEKPRDAENYTFERGARLHNGTGQGGQGWADVWKRGCFAWEYKAPGRDLNAALKQLMNYALALDNPPLLVVSDLRTIEIHTHFTGHPSEIHRIEISQLTQPETLQKLKWLFNEPERFKPQRTTYAVTELAAKRIGEIAKRLNERGNAAEEVAHFLIQCVFCMFAEDAKLLPEKLFETVLDKSNPDGSKAQKRLGDLFNAMQGGGDFAMHDIPWFNGGLFKQINVPALETADVVSLLEAARMDWSQIEPAILGTLFERGLNPDMRSQLGAHYTDPATIMKIIKPVIEQPLLAEWQIIKEKIAKLAPKMALVGSAKSNHPNQEMLEGYQLFRDFLTRLRNFKVLDPACGSGNFLYLALKTLKDLEHRVNLEVETFGLHRELSIETSPANVLGIELNPYAAELARVTVWIGEIQWMLSHGYQYRKDPILAPLDHIENRDAILNAASMDSDFVGGACSPESLAERTSCSENTTSEHVSVIRGHRPLLQEAVWPVVDAIVGNPPFLGGSKKRRELGDSYFNALSATYQNRVPDGADLVCYWFEKARAHIEQGKASDAGLVATNSIRGGSNRKVLARILSSGSIFEAWSDEEWVNNGAAVRVSLVCFGNTAQTDTTLANSTETPNTTVIPAKAGIHVSNPESFKNPMDSRFRGNDAMLDGKPVATIHADLTAGGGLDLTQAKPLKENINIAFRGTTKNGAFELKGELARQWLKQPNPNNKPNSTVLRPWLNGQDVTNKNSDYWIIDFGVIMPEAKAALFELPYQHVLNNVKVERQKNTNQTLATKWWIFERSRADLREAIQNKSRFIATLLTSKHRLFVWLPTSVIPDQALVAITVDNDTTFGILHSRFHELWSLRMGTSLEDRPRYTPTTCFETFPFPEGLTPNSPSVMLPPSPQPLSQRARDLNSPLPQAGLVQTYPLAGLVGHLVVPPEGLGVREAIATAAINLNQLRENWLNPSEWVNWEITPEEEKASYPKRAVAKAGFEAELKKRTLTNLYNQCPAWLDNAHKTLDLSVATAYGWADYTPDMPDDEILRRLLKLNLERSEPS
jgi:hypothetical protein